MIVGLSTVEPELTKSNRKADPMRRTSLLLTGWLLLGVLGAGTSPPAHAASPPSPRLTAAFASVVIEWFQVLRPSAGRREVVYARLLNNNRPVPGAHLSARVYGGTALLATVRGATTGRKGIAGAHFRVPGSAHGKTLRVVVHLQYKGHTYVGRNDLRVAG